MVRELRGSLRRYFPTQYLIPVVLLLGSSIGCLLALLFHTTAVQDGMEHRRESEFVRKGVEDTAELTAHDLQDYARWDDAVRHMVLRTDSRWADHNISAYLSLVQGYDHVLVIDQSGRTLYAFSHGKRAAPGGDAAALVGPQVRRVQARMDASGQVGTGMSKGFSRIGNRIYVLAIAAIVPLTDTVVAPPDVRRFLVIAKRIEPTMFATLTQTGQTPSFRLGGAAPPGASFVNLIADDDASRLWWMPHKPGTELRGRLLPGFLVVTLIALIASWLILRRARKGIDALRSSQEEAMHRALHDTLTGLGNRRAMIERLKATLAPATLLYMDLDGFKETNDVYGHAAGDELLVEAAQRIARAATGADLVARSGGDEFAVIVPAGIDCGPLTEAILSRFKTPFSVGGYNVSVGISIGVAESARGIDAAELIRRADVAMYAAKNNGKDGCCAYDPAMDEEHDERRRLESDLRVAIARGEIGVVFQPIMEADGRSVIGVEALARWRHPRLGQIAPDIFVRVAEQSGLINDLGRSVLTVACREALHWNVDLAVNLSPAQFWDRTLVQRVEEVLAATGFPPRRLELEITESYLLRRPDAAEAILLQLRALGISIALDDFGTGFASIGYLRRLSFDRIKIDRSFVTDVALEARAAELARSIVALADALGLPVTAEGIETEAQATIMRMVGCDRLQGWLFGRPMTAQAMTAWLADPQVATA